MASIFAVNLEETVMLLSIRHCRQENVVEIDRETKMCTHALLLTDTLGYYNYL